MNKQMLDLAKQATDESWDAYRIMAAFTDLQKQQDIAIAEAAGSPEIADMIRVQ